MKREHFSEYDEVVTARCERVLLTLLGDIGPWNKRIYLAGGLAPRYLIGTLPEAAQAHVGTTDIDVVIGLSLGDESPEVYRTLENNLRRAGFKDEASFRWTRVVDGVSVQLEFLCDTDQVEPGRIFKPKGESAGSGLGAFNVPGAQLASRDFIECDIEGERLDDGGRSRVTVRVVNLLPYTVLKILSFQDRHENKDAYDPVFCILNHEGGPRAAGIRASQSPVARERIVTDALDLLAERFASSDDDGPAAYAAFLATPGDAEEAARLRREAVAVVQDFLEGIREGSTNQ